MRPKMLVSLLVLLSLISLIPFAAGDQTPEIAINGCQVGADCSMDPGYVPYTLSGRQVSFMMELTLGGKPDNLKGSPRELPFQVCSTSGGCEYVNAYVTPIPGNPMENPNGGDNPWTLGYYIHFNIPVYMNGIVTFGIPAGCCTDSQGNIFPPTTITIGFTIFPYDPNLPRGGCMVDCGGGGGSGGHG